jgi:hypothetical protein
MIKIKGIVMGWLSGLAEHLGMNVDTVKNAYDRSTAKKTVDKVQDAAKQAVSDFVDKSMALEEFRQKNLQARKNGATGIVWDGKDVDEVDLAVKSAIIPAIIASKTPMGRFGKSMIKKGSKLLKKDDGLASMLTNRNIKDVQKMDVVDKRTLSDTAKQVEVDNMIAQQKALEFWKGQKPANVMDVTRDAQQKSAQFWDVPGQQAARNAKNLSVMEGLAKSKYMAR